MDGDGDVCTAYLSPDRDVVLTRAVVATNHQGRVEWHEHARATKSVERERGARARSSARARRRSASSTASCSRRSSPSTATGGMGTLYTVAYHVGEARAEFRWPDGRWEQRFGAFTEGVRVVELTQSSAA